MITEKDISAFMGLVDEAACNPPVLTSQTEAELFFGLTSNQSSVSPIERAWDALRTKICTPSGRPMSDMRALERTLFRRSRLQPTFRAHSHAIRKLLYGISADQHLQPFTERTSWVLALSMLECSFLQMYSGCDLDSHIGLDRDEAVASAVLRLRARGYKIGMDGERFVFEEGEMERCSLEIHKAVRQSGGRALISSLLHHLQNNKRFIQGRYLVGRVSRPPHQPDPMPAIPWGYLLNVAFRHITETPSTNDITTASQNTVKLAADLIATLDVETYSNMAHLSVAPERLPTYIQDLVVADHALSFPQIVAKDLLIIMDNVFANVGAQPQNEMISQLGWGINEAQQLAHYVLTSIPETSIGAVFRRKDLLRSKIPNTVLDKMLPWFAHDAQSVNKRYLTPLDAQQADAQSKPFVRLPKNAHFLASAPYCSTGFYEATVAALRSVIGTEADASIGRAIETTMDKAFRTKGITPSVASKKYNMNGVEGDADLILETDTAIVLIELKKKSMCRASRSGDTTQAFIDLFQGAIKAQVQLGHQEILLRTKGYLAFEDGTRVPLKGRTIERLAVTLLDWGGTQDRMAFRAAIYALWSGRIGSDTNDTRAQARLADANKLMDELRGQMQKLVSLGVDGQNPFFNWWFTSVPQLLFLLKTAGDANSFYANLRKVKSMSYGTLDFYEEFMHAESVVRPA